MSREWTSAALWTLANGIIMAIFGVVFIWQRDAIEINVPGYLIDLSVAICFFSAGAITMLATAYRKVLR